MGRFGRLTSSSRIIASSAIAGLTLFLWFCIGPQPTFGDSASYHYDDAGRLTRVIKGTSGAIYHYDQLGNLVSVNSSTTVASPPIINSISPNVLFVDSTLLVRISGENLLATDSIISDNPTVNINRVWVTDSEITAEMTASSTGGATITVITPYGTASRNVTLSSSALEFTPGQLAIIPGTSGDLSVSIDPPLSNPLTINLNNHNPTIVSAPSTLTIPSTGTMNFSVDGLQEGVAMISAGDPRSVVIVGPPFSGDVAGLTAGKVSVHLETLQESQCPTSAHPVSVHIDTPSVGSSPFISLPVSVFLNPPLPQEWTAQISGYPVSVHLDAPSSGLFSGLSTAVSVHIDSAPSYFTIKMTNQVSVHLDTPIDNSSTTISDPVSVEIQ